MPQYTYLLIGGGMTADAATQGIHEVDPTGTIGLIGSEPVAPYNRPPLSKGLWKGDTLESIRRATAERGVAMHLGRTARTLDPAGKRVTDDTGVVYTYDNLLLATGGTPRRLPFGGEEIIYYRTLADYERLRALTAWGQRFAVIGGGFIGAEIAAALAMNGKEVVLIFPRKGIGDRLFPSEHGRFFNDLYGEHGVAVAAQERAVGMERRGQRHALTLRHVRTGEVREILVAGVIAGLGITPNVALAQQAGLIEDNGMAMNGVEVDASLRTSDPAIYAAGMWPTSPTPPSVCACGWSTKTTPIRWAAWRAARWRAAPNPTITCPSSPPISSTCVTRRSGRWTRCWRWWPIGGSGIARACSITCAMVGCAGYCCGISGGK